MTLKEKILALLCFLFFISLFTNEVQILTGIAIGGLALSAVTFNSFREKWVLLKERTHIIFMLLFFLMLLISIGLSEDKGRGFRYLDTRLALFYFPLSIGLIKLRKDFKDKVLLGLAIITTTTCLVCLGWGIHRSYFFRRTELLYNDSLTEILGRQSIYVSLLVTISIFILGYWAFYKSISRTQKMLVNTSIFFLYIISFLLASRNMMVVLYGGSLLFAGRYLFRQKKYLQIGLLSIGILIGGLLLVKFSPKTLNRFKELEYTQFDYNSKGQESHYNAEVTADQWNGANFRLAAWPCGWLLFKQHPLVGVGLGDKQTKLLDVYRTRGFDFAIATNKNIHNNYLDVLYSTGAISFLFFLLGWIVLPLITMTKQRDWLAIFIIATVAIAMVTEVYFDRTIGGWLAGFFIPFLLTDTKKGRQP
jgi:O-antigen ligase